jgi:hypothetical protein
MLAARHASSLYRFGASVTAQGRSPFTLQAEFAEAPAVQQAIARCHVHAKARRFPQLADTTGTIFYLLLPTRQNLEKH